MTLQRFFIDGPVPAFKEAAQTFYEAAATRIDYLPLGETRPFLDLRLRALQGLCVVEGRTSPYRNLVQAGGVNDTDVLKLGLLLRGTMRSEQNGADIAMQAGSAALIAADRPASISAHDPTHTLAIAIPREMLAPRLDKLDLAMGGGVLPSPELRLLQAYASTLVAEETAYAAETEAQIAVHLCDLLNVLLGANKEDAELARHRGTHAAHLTAIKKDIAANIANPDLSLAWLSRRHGMGMRAIRNLFYAEDANFTDYLLAQRLEFAHSILAGPDGRSRTIISIAFEAGFEDISWFNRTFRRRFGMTPREARDMAATSFS